MDQARIDGNLPGVGVLVKIGGNTLFSHSQGKRSLQNQAVVEGGDLWHLGSDTKAMTAFLIALAVERGQIQYDTRLADFFGKTYRFHELNRDLTLADVLTHGSGLKDLPEIQGGQLWKDLSKSKRSVLKQRDELIHAAFAEGPHTDPNNAGQASRSFRYANVNYIIAGAVLEKIYGQAWEQVITKYLFRPLKMKSCGFGVAGHPTETEPSQPWPHVFERNQLIGVPPKYRLDNPPFVGPAGTVHCNLQDWSAFISELILTWKGRGNLLKDPRVIQRYFATPRGSKYTFGGWGRDDDKYGTPTFSHNGSNTFNYAIAFFAPEREALMLLTTNVGVASAEQAMIKLSQYVSDAMMAETADDKK